MPHSKLTRLLLPLPLAPTIATRSPASICKSTFFSAAIAPQSCMRLMPRNAISGAVSADAVDAAPSSATCNILTRSSQSRSAPSMSSGLLQASATAVEASRCDETAIGLGEVLMRLQHINEAVDVVAAMSGVQLDSKARGVDRNSWKPDGIDMDSFLANGKGELLCPGFVAEPDRNDRCFRRSPSAVQ